MATTRKISRKELKQPDEFISFWSRAFQYAQRHRREVIIGVAGIVVFLLLLWGGQVRSQRREAEAARLLGQAQSLLQERSPAGQGQGEGGQEQAGTADSSGKALALLEDLVGRLDGTKASRLARVLLGHLYYERGDYQKAIETYDQLVEKDARSPELKALAWEGLAYAYEAQGQFERAVEYYDRLSRVPLPNVQGWACLGLARCYERLGEMEKALAAYRTLLADHPQHPKAAEAKASIARLSSSAAEREPMDSAQDAGGNNPG